VCESGDGGVEEGEVGAVDEHHLLGVIRGFTFRVYSGVSRFGFRGFKLRVSSCRVSGVGFRV